MKKTPFIIIAVAAALTAGCQAAGYDVLVHNASAKTVSYSYDGTNDTLAAGTSKQYAEAAWTAKPKDIKVVASVSDSTEKTLSIVMEGDGAGYTFKDAKEQRINSEMKPVPIPLHVINTLPVEVTLRAGSYIDENNNSNPELTVSLNAVSTTAQIYTRLPSFGLVGANSGYPAVIEWRIDNDVMYVTIK